MLSFFRKLVVSMTVLLNTCLGIGRGLPFFLRCLPFSVYGYWLQKFEEKKTANGPKLITITHDLIVLTQ